MPNRFVKRSNLLNRPRRTRTVGGVGAGDWKPLATRLGRTMILLQKATIMVACRLRISMPTTLTLKNIPDEVYVRLKASAQSHRRSLNSEAIVCLESVLLPGRASAEAVIARARAIRETLPNRKFSAKDIDAFKREGRP